MTNSTHLIDYVVIGCYLIFLVVIGAAFHRFNKNVSDFFRSGCRGTWWLVGASVFMGNVTANSFTSSAGVAFQAGWSVAIIYIGNAAGYFVNFLFLAAWFRQLRATTGPEVIRMRFGPITQQVYAIHGIFTGILSAGITLWAVAAFSATAFGFKISLIIAVLGSVGVLYSIMGGLWGVMATDFVQGMILIPMTILVAVLCLARVGGISGFIHAITSNGMSHTFAIVHRSSEFPDRSFTLAWAAAMIFKQTWDQNALSISNRYFAVKDGKAARKAAMVAVIMMLTAAIFWFIPPMTARILYEQQTLAAPLHNPAEAAFAVAALHVLPNGMIGLMAVTIFAATLSSMDTGLNRNAAVAMKDIYPLLCRALRRPLASENTQLFLSRVMTLFFGICIVGTAIYFSNFSGRGIFEIILDIGVLVSLPLTVPLVWALFIRRVPAWSALFSAAVGLIYSLIVVSWPRTLSFQQRVLGGLLAGSISFLITQLFWSKVSDEYRAQVAAFFKRMHTPVDFEKEVGAANDTQQLTMIGGFMIAVAIFICMLLLIPNDLRGRLSILFVGGVVMIMGLLMRWAARRGQNTLVTDGIERT